MSTTQTFRNEKKTNEPQFVPYVTPGQSFWKVKHFWWFTQNHQLLFSGWTLCRNEIGKTTLQNFVLSQKIVNRFFCWREDVDSFINLLLFSDWQTGKQKNLLKPSLRHFWPNKWALKNPSQTTWTASSSFAPENAIEKKEEKWHTLRIMYSSVRNRKDTIFTEKFIGKLNLTTEPVENL